MNDGIEGLKKWLMDNFPWEDDSSWIPCAVDAWASRHVVIKKEDVEDKKITELVEECLKGCEHDGSYVPGSEVRRLMKEIVKRLISEVKS